MGLKFKKLFGVHVSITNVDEVLDKTRKYLEISNIHPPAGGSISNKNSIKPLVIFTPNPEIIVYAQKDKAFNKIVNCAQIAIADGAGVAWALRKLYNIRIRAIPGVELMEKLCQEAAINGYRIGLIGGREGLAVETAECLLKSYPKLKIEVFDEPEIRIKNQEARSKNTKNINILNSYFSILDSEKKSVNTEKYFIYLTKEIVRLKIDILFVALGFPKQEYFINQLAGFQVSSPPVGGSGKRPLIMMGVGGSFEYIAGRIKRAPNWMRKRGLEWLFRLLREPWRMKRHIIGSKFFLKVLLSGKSNSTILAI